MPSSPWPINKDEAGWVGATLNGAPGMQTKDKFITVKEKVKERNQTLRAFNAIVYWFIVFLISQAFMFAISMTSKLEWVHIVKIFWAVVLIFSMYWLSRYLNINM